MAAPSVSRTCRYEGNDSFWCVVHHSDWSRDEACDQVYIDAERDEADRVLQRAKDERWQQ